MSNRQYSKKKVFSNKAVAARRQKSKLVDQFEQGLIGIEKVDYCETAAGIASVSYRVVFRGQEIDKVRAMAALRSLFVRHGLAPSLAAKMTQIKFEKLDTAS